MKFILLINVKRPAIVDILTFLGRISDCLWGFKPENFHCGYFDIFEQFKFQAKLNTELNMKIV